MKMLAWLCLPLLLAACVTTDQSFGQYPEGPARIGETVYVDGPTVRPIAIVEDSRCPADVTCVWAGRVVIRAEVRAGREKKVMTLELDQPVELADGALMLHQVRPEKRQGEPVKPGDYLFYFRFTGGI